MPVPYQFLANLVLAAHLCIVAFVVLGLALIIFGNLRRWRWVNHLWFRLAHGGAIAVVVLESWFGFTCPLTTFEMWLRVRTNAATYGGGFIEHWFGRLLYYEAPPWAFLLAYSVFGVLVLAAWCYFPPRLDRARHKPGANAE